jgi:hypothetical protein
MTYPYLGVIQQKQNHQLSFYVILLRKNQKFKLYENNETFSTNNFYFYSVNIHCHGSNQKYFAVHGMIFYLKITYTGGKRKQGNLLSRGFHITLVALSLKK